MRRQASCCCRYHDRTVPDVLKGDVLRSGCCSHVPSTGAAGLPPACCFRSAGISSIPAPPPLRVGRLRIHLSAHFRARHAVSGRRRWPGSRRYCRRTCLTAAVLPRCYTPPPTPNPRLCACPEGNSAKRRLGLAHMQGASVRRSLRTLPSWTRRDL